MKNPSRQSNHQQRFKRWDKQAGVNPITNIDEDDRLLGLVRSTAATHGREVSNIEIMEREEHPTTNSDKDDRLLGLV